MLYQSLRQIKISLHFNVFFFQTSNQSDWIPPEIQSPIGQSNADVNTRGGINSHTKEKLTVKVTSKSVQK